MFYRSVGTHSPSILRASGEEELRWGRYSQLLSLWGWARPIVTRRGVGVLHERDAACPVRRGSPESWGSSGGVCWWVSGGEGRRGEEELKLIARAPCARGQGALDVSVRVLGGGRVARESGSGRRCTAGMRSGRRSSVQSRRRMPRPSLES